MNTLWSASRGPQSLHTLPYVRLPASGYVAVVCFNLVFYQLFCVCSAALFTICITYNVACSLGRILEDLRISTRKPSIMLVDL